MSNKTATYKGKTKNLSQWARSYKVDGRVFGKFIRMGYDFEAAIAKCKESPTKEKGTMTRLEYNLLQQSFIGESVCSY